MEERPHDAEPVSRPSDMAVDMTTRYKEIMELAKSNPEMAVARMNGIIDFWVQEGAKGVSPKKAFLWKKQLQEALTTGNWASIRNDPGAAVQFVITNILMGTSGLGIKQYGAPREARINTVANMMEFTVDFDTMQLISEANHYGFEICALNEETKKCKKCDKAFEGQGEFCCNGCADDYAAEEEAKEQEKK